MTTHRWFKHRGFQIRLGKDYVVLDPSPVHPGDTRRHPDAPAFTLLKDAEAWIDARIEREVAEANAAAVQRSKKWDLTIPETHLAYALIEKGLVGSGSAWEIASYTIQWLEEAGLDIDILRKVLETRV